MFAFYDVLPGSVCIYKLYPPVIDYMKIRHISRQKRDHSKRLCVNEWSLINLDDFAFTVSMTALRYLTAKIVCT